MAGSFDLGGLCNCGCGGCSAKVCVTDCNGLAVSGATVTIAATGGDVSGTTDTTGCVTLDIGSAGTYNTTVAAAGYQTYDGDLSYTCGVGSTVTLQPAGTLCTLFVYGCNGVAVDGATVTINGKTYTTANNGYYKDGTAQFSLPGAGSYPYTVTASRYNSYSGTMVVTDLCTSCSDSCTLTAATGYVCCNLYASCPLPETLYLTDSLYGSTTLTYDPASGTAGQWIGTLDASYPGGCGCSAVAVTITYTYDCTQPTDANPAGFGIEASNGSNAGSGTCPGNDPGGQLSCTGNTVVSSCPFELTASCAACSIGTPALYYSAATITVTE